MWQSEDTASIKLCFRSVGLNDFAPNIDAKVNTLIESLGHYHDQSHQIFQTVANLLAARNYNNLQNLTRLIMHRSHLSSIWEIQTNCESYIFYYNLDTKKAMLQKSNETTDTETVTLLSRESNETFLSPEDEVGIRTMITAQLAESEKQLNGMQVEPTPSSCPVI